MTANDVTYVEMSPDQVSQSIPGQIDAGLVWEPYTSQALKQGKVVSLSERQLFPTYPQAGCIPQNSGG